MEFAKLPAAASLLIPLYDGYLSAWETKMNQLSFVQIIIQTSKQYPGMYFRERGRCVGEVILFLMILCLVPCLTLSHLRLRPDQHPRPHHRPQPHTHSTSPHKDPKNSIAFLEKASKKVEDKDAYVLCVMEAAHFKLLLRDMEGTKAAMEECEKILDLLDGVDPIIHASFYRVSADYNKVCLLACVLAIV